MIELDIWSIAKLSRETHVLNCFTMTLLMEEIYYKYSFYRSKNVNVIDIIYGEDPTIKSYYL